MAKSLGRALERLDMRATDVIDKAECVEAWAHTRTDMGLTGTPRLLGNPLDNVKISKNGTPTWTLTLAPASTSGEVNTCDKSTAQCRKACVMWTSGRQYDTVRNGRIARTLFAQRFPLHFLSLLTHEVRALDGRGTPYGLRLNVASDLRWEYIAPWLFDGENVRAYDYTKWSYGERGRPTNYLLTYSHTERWDESHTRNYLSNGQNVAMVFDTPKHTLPKTHLGFRVIDGDLSDYRFADPRGVRGVIVGLAAKGAAKDMDTGGFVTHVSLRRK